MVAAAATRQDPIVLSKARKQLGLSLFLSVADWPSKKNVFASRLLMAHLISKQKNFLPKHKRPFLSPSDSP